MCQEVKQADSAYIAGTYGRFDAVMLKGEGAHYEGPDGKRYIDFGTGIGVTLFGACDPDWVAAVTHQLTTLGHTSNLYYTEPQTQLAKLLCERTGMKKVFFGNSGAEANECALKVARKYGEKDNRDVIVTLVNSFHGRTIATLAATGQDRFHEHFGPFPAGFRYTPANDIPALEAINSWTTDAIHDTLIDLAARLEVKNATLMWPVRIAAAGKLVTPGGAVEICHLLGKDETLRRLHLGLDKLK